MADQIEGLTDAQRRDVGVMKGLGRLRDAFVRVPVALQGAIVALPGCLVFFRAAFLSGFDRIGGDQGDARLIVLLHEHWVNVIRGRASWRSPPFFFPIKGTLGYSDTFLLNQVFFAPLRLLGMDAFLAFELTVVILAIVGCAGMYVLVRRLGLSLLPSAAVATAFVTANNLFIKALHPQMYGVYWLPVLLLLVTGAVGARSRLRQLGWGAAAGGLYGLILFSYYYIGWFIALAALVWVLCCASLRLRHDGARPMIGWLRVRFACLAGALGGLSIALIPFLVLYLPVLRASGGRTYEQVMSYAANPREALNVGGTNLVWGSLLRGLEPADRLQNVEVNLAPTPLLMLMCVVAGYIGWRAREGVHRVRADWCLAGSLTSMILVVLPIRFSRGSLWRVPWTIVPGASGVRAIDRLQIVTAPVMCLTIAVAASLVTQLPRVAQSASATRWTRRALSALLLFAAVEQINTGTNHFIDRSDELRTAASAPSPPTSCRSFFIIDSAVPPRPAALSSVSAMLISQTVDLPTVNGYSGQVPPGYALQDPAAPDYQSQVRAWVIEHGVEAGLCSYDDLRREWTRTP